MAVYIQGLLAQYAARVSEAAAIGSGHAYITGHQEHRRQLFDSMVRDGQVRYSIGGRYSMTPMFGKYLLMPILQHDTKVGVLANSNEN